ncbi:MAG: hypothetical protein ACJ0QS_08645 [Parvicellaceae bacterium]|jgi:hypothetical protein|nr:hypothetical protein [Flavobacteriales bacterium]CAI8169167.1 MAG: Uncharacterised protein [Crocinitomicaceae bacterium]|tara:strand:- start:276 stop:749 length:474 start_codon:yes stop_codon:yes gene_type:complete
MKNFDALKWLCLLSLIGFIYCFVSDIGYFFLFLDDLSVESEKSSFLNLVIDNLGENGFEFNEYLASQLRSLYALRIVFDILAMVGVALMYLKIKLGWTFYWIFQVAYVLAPYIFLNFEFQASWPYFTGIALVMFPLFNNMIHLVYVLLFMSQRAQLK